MTKRDPARRERILRLLEKAWLRPEHSDARLLQLLMNTVAEYGDVFYVEDDRLEEALRSKYVVEPAEWKNPLGGPAWRYVPCECSSAHHFIAFMPDPFDRDEVDVTFVSSRNASFWHRVKWALKHVFGREDLVFADAILPKRRLVELMRGLDA